MPKSWPAIAMLFLFVLLLAAAAANVVHGKDGVGFYLGASRQATWLITLGLFAIMMVVAGLAVKSRWDGIFVDEDNRISLSRFQLILWTTLLISALLTAGLTNAMAPNPAAAPLAIDIPPEIWALLGLGAFTAVAARAIEDGQRATPGGAGGESPVAQPRLDRMAQSVKDRQGLTAKPTFDGRLMVKAAPEDARWLDLIMGDQEGGGYVDVSKLQKLAFTVMLILVYGMALWTIMAISGTGTARGIITKFPPVDPGFLALLGISHAAYLADKQLAST